MKNYKLKIDLPSHGLKKGSIFEYDREECCYVSKDLPFFLTPLVEREEIKNKKIFQQIKN